MCLSTSVTLFLYSTCSATVIILNPSPLQLQQFPLFFHQYFLSKQLLSFPHQLQTNFSCFGADSSSKESFLPSEAVRCHFGDFCSITHLSRIGPLEFNQKYKLSIIINRKSYKRFRDFIHHGLFAMSGEGFSNLLHFEVNQNKFL